MTLGGQGRLAALKAAATAGKLDGRFLIAGRCGVYMALGFVMSCSRILENGAPFGMAMVACSGPGLAGVFALAGSSLGYLMSGGIEWGIRYIAAAVLVYTISFVFHELGVYRRPFFMPAASGFVMALTGFLGSFSASAGTQCPSRRNSFWRRRSPSEGRISSARRSQASSAQRRPPSSGTASPP